MITEFCFFDHFLTHFLSKKWIKNWTIFGHFFKTETSELFYLRLMNKTLFVEIKKGVIRIILSSHDEQNRFRNCRALTTDFELS